MFPSNTIQNGLRVTSVSSIATAAINVDTTDVYVVSNLTSSLVVAKPDGTPSDEQYLEIRIKDSGTSRSLAFHSVFVSRGGLIPASTIIGKWTILTCLYNTNLSTWDLISTSVSI